MMSLIRKRRAAVSLMYLSRVTHSSRLCLMRWLGRRPARTALPPPPLHCHPERVQRVEGTAVVCFTFVILAKPESPYLFTPRTEGHAFTRAEERSLFEPFASLTAYRSRTRNKSSKTPANPHVKPLDPPKIPLTHTASTTSPRKILGIVVMLQRVELKVGEKKGGSSAVSDNLDCIPINYLVSYI